MIFAFERSDLGVANIRDGGDCAAILFQTEALPCEDMLVADGVQVGEPT